MVGRLIGRFWAGGMRLLVCLAHGVAWGAVFAVPPIGQWQVNAVSVNADREDRLLYQINDPRLPTSPLTCNGLHAAREVWGH